MKKILIIHGHPVKETFIDCLKDSYKDAAQKAGAETREIVLRDLDFEINFKEGYRGSQALEGDLSKAQQDIQWADHLVFFIQIGGLLTLPCSKALSTGLFCPALPSNTGKADSFQSNYFVVKQHDWSLQWTHLFGITTWCKRLPVIIPCVKGYWSFVAFNRSGSAHWAPCAVHQTSSAISG